MMNPIRAARNLIGYLYTKLYFCILERRIPFLKRHAEDLVDRKWHRELEHTLRHTARIKVGFGPIFSGENDLHVRKWRIDPIVNSINKISDRYSAGIFLTPESMARFDVIVFVREIDDLDLQKISELKAREKIFIYDIVDRAYHAELGTRYGKTMAVVGLMDGLIASSPLHIKDFKPFGKISTLIEHPVLNTKKKEHVPGNNRETRIIWQGFLENQTRMRILHPIIKNLADELHTTIKMIYHTNTLPRREDFVEYRTWTVRNWEDMLIHCDIAVEIKALDDPLLQRKPSTKVLTYMAAGLPVVCTPSRADRLLLENGRTGYFAYTADDWRIFLKKLIQNPALRKTMGENAREYAVKTFTIEAITGKYIDLFNDLTGGNKQ